MTTHIGRIAERDLLYTVVTSYALLAERLYTYIQQGHLTCQCPIQITPLNVLTSVVQLI